MLTLLVLISSLSLFGQNQKQRFTGKTIKEIVKLPESEIDLGLACLVLAKEVYPELEIDTYVRMLDIMAYNISIIAKGCEDPEARIGAINTFLYKDGSWNDFQKFEYDLADLLAVEKKNNFINGYLDSKTGSCITMPMLYAILSQRLNYPIYIVDSPKHFFCRYVDENFKENNIETTVNGGFTDDSEYIESAGINLNSIENGVYMRTLTNKEYISRLICINARYYFEYGDVDKAIKYLELAIEIDKTNAGGIWNYAVVTHKKAQELEKLMKIEIEGELVQKQIDSEYQDEINNIKMSYIPKINNFINLSKSSKQNALDLGIVLELSPQFFEKQNKSIKRYKEIGGIK